MFDLEFDFVQVNVSKQMLVYERFSIGWCFLTVKYGVYF